MTASIAQAVSCVDGYDPDALRVDKAREAIRACLVPVCDTETVPVRESLGRVLAQDIVPAINVPGHDNSAMDGWAVRGVDLNFSGEFSFREVGKSFAGKPYSGKIDKGECVRVMTGAVMPKGADTVVVQEICKADGDRVAIPAGQKAGQNVRAAGEDLKAGVPVLKAGQPVRAAELGLIASLGIGELKVRRRLRVAFFSTGDELASIGTALREGEVYDSNRYTLHGMLARLGVEVADMGVVRDDPLALEKAFVLASEHDVIITTGGVSVGEADFVKQLMAKLGEVLFWKIAMRPGRPMAFGRIGGGENAAFLFGLPGNPVAVMVTFYQFVREALLYLSGVSLQETPLLLATSAQPIRKIPGRTEYQRGVLYKDGNTWKVRTTGQQGSGVLRSMSEANCFIVLEHERGKVEAGEQVSVQLMDTLA
jgi:molybdopterin molybdotransferase